MKQSLLVVLFFSALSFGVDEIPKVDGLQQARPQSRFVTLKETPWWNPTKAYYSIGYEGAGTSTAILGQNAIAYGNWVSDTLGWDAFFGYTKAADSSTETTAVVTNTTATSQTSTSTYSGSKSAHNFILGGALKYKIFQNEWFLFNVGAIAAAYVPNSTEYRTGSSSTSTPATGSPTNKTITETALGTVKTETGLQFAVGPKISTEFYLRWFPHLAIGFSTGVFTTFNGDVTTTTSTRSRTYAVVNGVDQTATSDASTTSTAVTKYGLRGTTFGIGGTTFQLNGIFSIRYIW